MAKSLHFLVADDNPTDRSLLATYAESMGWTSIMVADGDVAVACADIERFDALVLDQRMPGRSGLETARRLRRGSGPNAMTPILIWTATITPELVEEADALHLVDVVEKPLSLAVFGSWAVTACNADDDDASGANRASAS